MKSTTNQGKEHVGYNSVVIFIRLAVVAPRAPKSAKFCDVGANQKRIYYATSY